jgi:hypothetical protein
MVEEVALTPTTVPLSMSLPWVKVLAPFQMETKPALPEPMVESLLLKVVQSVEES